jgi:hypothetical protein
LITYLLEKIAMHSLIFALGREAFSEKSAEWSGTPKSIRDEALRLAGLALSHHEACGSQEIFVLPETERPASASLNEAITKCRSSESALERQVLHHLSVWG